MCAGNAVERSEIPFREVCLGMRPAYPHAAHRLTDRKSHSHAAGFRGEERLKHFFSYLRIDAGTRIRNFIKTVPAPSTWLLSRNMRAQSPE